MTDPSTFPGGFPDRAAADRVSMAVSCLEMALFNLERAGSALGKAVKQWPEAKSSADILSQYIKDGIDDSGIRHLLEVAEDRLNQFEEDMLE